MRRSDMAAERLRQKREAQRDQRRAHAVAVWGNVDPVQRTSMLIAALLLDRHGEHNLADWLHCARPERAVEVATAVAVHALRRALDCVWDVLMACDAANYEQAVDAYMADADYTWEPPAGYLIWLDEPAETALAGNTMQRETA